ncbi:MAG: CDP-glycerol glycerophosphotransferase family protein [Chlamydiota bacterium]
MNRQCVALNYASHKHYNDHLAPISVVMGIPLVVVETEDYEVCKNYYPDLIVEMTEYHDFNPQYLIEHYDTLFMSDLWDRKVLKNKFKKLEKKYHKCMRNVHVPHGFSDKGFYIRKAANEDITLVYGQNMLDMFRNERVLHNLHQYVVTGNFRYSYFKMYEAFYDKLMKEKILSHLESSRKTILYAPTWMDLEKSSTYFDCIEQLLAKLPREYNMIVKPHPQLEIDDIAAYYRTLGICEKYSNVLVLTDFPPIYPILKYSDLYIGDMSSIGYDYLAFNRPMYFINKKNRNPQKDRRSFLFNCGIDIKIEEVPNIYEIIAETIDSDSDHFTNIRAEVWDYTFGRERSFEEIRKDIINAIETPIDEPTT